MTNLFEKKLKELFAYADVTINGNRPWDIRVFNEKFYRRALMQGSLGLGEAYMDGWWDADNIDQFICKVLIADLYEKVKGLPMLWFTIKGQLMNLQKKSKAYKIGRRHYDIGNDLFTLMLDKGMNYSCGYWKDAKNLDQAQMAKLDLICKKIGLKPGMSVLDIGCGWGGFAKYAAEKYNVNVIGITISKEQAELAKEICKGLPVVIKLQDYRSLQEKFDRIVSVGMIEHVGYKNYRVYMKIVHDCLQEDGLFLLQTIGVSKSLVFGDAWMDKYIFPDAMLPSPTYISRAVEGLFVMEDWHNFGADYDHTLMAWYDNFEKNWDRIKKNKKYDDKFYQVWKYYLLSCAGACRSRYLQLWQIVFSRKGLPGGYESTR
jgi:cyclopropane-fatty-acyl-phospholipid synthase